MSAPDNFSETEDGIPERAREGAPATPRPWVCTRPPESNGYWYIDAANDAGWGMLATLWGARGEADADARLIILAVNNHDPLVETLRELLAFAKDAPPELLKRAAAALAAAEGEASDG